ncbi:hypothetical protein KORDIASMS9_00018 [Kordia sp. SMS9]|uniref:hypothetical protein n=1 Tax=Kordia sp. SMS9 TaxID=2282170 RepID=UPI000E0D9134|nr:hypothetical protein [Kordia sp. SMS9]AXG67836.1 hypothetical protein KORDIASMS9_00018 [Kordia sp. SMS9]
MIIFNLAAILVVLLAAVLSIPFIIIYALGGMNEKILVICMSWMILVASFIGKSGDFNGRLFFIPMWILSIPVPFIFTYATYQWAGIGVTFGIFLAFIGLVIGFLYLGENKRMNKLRFEKIEFPNQEEDPLAYWEAVKDKFFSPTFLKMTPEIGRFNSRVAEALQRDHPELAHLEAYKQEMGKAGSKRKKINPEAAENLMAEIDEKINMLKEAAELLEKAPS